MRIALISLGLLFVSGCYTSQVAPNTHERINEQITRVEDGKSPGTSDQEIARLALLFSDRPDYVALTLNSEEILVRPRLRTSITPKYPLSAYLRNAKAQVNVAIIISENGAVEEARVLESADTLFSNAAIEAVKQWTFEPGSRGGIPAKFLYVVPIRFDGRQ
jgi:TonB family protein